MRLFLSSQDLGHHAERALSMCGPGKRVAIVVNAQDDLWPDEREEKVIKKIALFNEAGFKAQELDLRDYFDKSDELNDFLQAIDLIWCNGGNTFILRRAMRASGFDKILHKKLEEDSIMYGGSSAGACICAPSLHGIEYGDRPSPEVVPDAYPDKITLWEGLNFVPFMIVPHCDQEWFNANVDPTVKALQSGDSEYILLNDGEVVVVDGNKTEVLQPSHESTRYRPISQKPYCCVPASLQMVLEKNGLPKLTQEEIGKQLGLVVPPEYADEFDSVDTSETPLVSSGFGTRIQDRNYSLEKLIEKLEWAFVMDMYLASTLADEKSLQEVLATVEKYNSDALICYQTDQGYGHVVVFDGIDNGTVHIVDPSPQHDKWCSMKLKDIYKRIKNHGDDNYGGVWIMRKNAKF